MSFENINKISTTDDTSCAMLYNFNSKELTMLKNICGLIGIKDKIVLNPKNGDTIVKDILNNNLDQNCQNGINNKAVIFNNINHTKIHTFIDSLKKFRIQLPLIAVVTETSINWDLNTVIKNLVDEREALKCGKKIEH